ncbi:hypothetical protein BU16DRAFT_521271 [Lophium mytilinum]|uniref:Uncharacterized protein n=1 Tax=Lophium mytilinum TaxID=390894 RepID=A0A6A6RFM8_9PEZI|nr:hypothetical protein BU16DRAFT_521271 [Lophium mytilinum]
MQPFIKCNYILSVSDYFGNRTLGDRQRMAYTPRVATDRKLLNTLIGDLPKLFTL